ncbi:MAG: family 16 glycosylhydrolase [Pseudomonadota bacterium]
MSDRAKSKRSAEIQAWRIDALVLGVFSAQTIIALAALSTKPAIEPSAPNLELAEVEIEALDQLPPPAIVPPQQDLVVPDPLPEDPSPAPAAPYRGPEAVPADQLIPSGDSFITLLGYGSNETLWYVARHSNENHPFFGNDWSPRSADFSNNGLRLHIEKDRGRWKSGELKSKTSYGYGRYEVVMKPAKSSGLVSAFFTYTGPYFGDPHDEIDIEFVGNNTSRVEFNYFKDGRTLNHRKHDLPFDASEDFHIYAYEWYPDRIRWFVDNKLVYETPEGDTNIPRTSASIHVNMWTGTLQGLKSWHGEPTFEAGTSSEYACISFTLPGDGSRRCSDVFQAPDLPNAEYVKLDTSTKSLKMAKSTEH